MKRGEKRTAEWWLPGMDPKDSVPGSYEVLNDGQVRVELYRALPDRANIDYLAGEDVEYPIIHGLAFGLPVTLVKVRVVSSKTNLGSGHVNTKLRPWIAVERLLLSANELRLTDLTVQVENQDVWDNHASFGPSVLRKNGFPSVINYNPIATEMARISDGEVCVTEASTYHPQRSDISLKSRSKFSLKFDDPISFEEITKRHIRSLLLMMTVATGRDCGVLDMSGTCREWKVEGERHPADRWVTVRVGKSSDDEKPLHVRDLLFNLDDLDWPKQAAHFFDVTTEWAYPIELWATLLSSKFFWPLGRFANAVQAIEALDRILHPNPPFTPDVDLAHRVNEALRKESFNSAVRSKVKEALLRPREASLDVRMARLSMRVRAAMAQLVGESRWEQNVARLRHVASHGLEDSEQFVADTTAPEVATEILLHLLECLFLERVGFDSSKIAELQERRSNFGYRRRIVREYLPLLDTFFASAHG